MSLSSLGGPLTLRDNGNRKTFVVGVTSIGPRDCGTPTTQALYTSVNFYVPWILDNIRR